MTVETVKFIELDQMLNCQLEYEDRCWTRLVLLSSRGCQVVRGRVRTECPVGHGGQDRSSVKLYASRNKSGIASKSHLIAGACVVDEGYVDIRKSPQHR